MSDYRCVNSFTDANGRRFSYGEEISSYYYSSLTYSEQINFTNVADNIISSNTDSSSILSSPAEAGYIATGGLSSDFDSGGRVSSSGDYNSDSSSSNNDFGGGDFGGGGTGSDY